MLAWSKFEAQMTGERIIPFSGKDRRYLRQVLAKQILKQCAQLAAVLLLVLALTCFRSQNYFRFLIGASVVLYAALLVLLFVQEGSPRLLVRLLRDWYLGKKRVIQGKVEHASYAEAGDGSAAVTYDIGPYRFSLKELSPLLKKFKQVMPGETVEVHQCLHSGFILRVESPKNKE